MAKNHRQAGGIYFTQYQDIYGVEALYGREVSHIFTRHTHRTLGLGFVEQGIRFFACRGETYEVSSGQIFIIPPEEEHTCYTLEGQSHSYRLLLVPASALQTLGLVPDERQVVFRQVVVNDSGIYEKLRQLHDLLSGEDTLFIKKSELLAFLGHIFENYAEEPSRTLPSQQYNQDIVKTVRQFIETNYVQCFSLEDIAQLVHVSPYHLLRLFSRAVGLPPHIYQQQVRIRHAKQMLAQGETLLQAAMRTGFADQSHFTKVFKKLVGITPGQYSVQMK